MINASSLMVLRNGIGVPCLGFGTIDIAAGDRTVQAVATALDAGYRHIDTADVSGNERDCARAIKDSGIPREDIFLSSKLWNSHRGYDSVMRAFEKTLRALRTDYLDLYLIHWPANEKNYGPEWRKINQQTWRAFEKLYDEAAVRAIGVCNFRPHHLASLEARTEPMVNEIEFHPGFMQPDTLTYCKEHEILVGAWSPLAAGRLLKDRLLQQIASIYGKSVSALAIRWCLQHGTVPIVRATKPAHILGDMRVFDFAISPEDMMRIDVIRHIGFSGLDPDRIVEPGRNFAQELRDKEEKGL